jgi:CRISPR/Cas system-associated exonuclease Cas4 (RecB family)
MRAALTDSSRSDKVATTERPSRIEELQRTVSASRLGLWQQCRLKFYFKYVLQVQKPPTGARHIGRVVHSVLQAWNKARWRKEALVEARFRGVFDQQWAEEQKEVPIKWAGEEEKERSGAWALLSMYFAQTPIPAAEKPEAVEVPAEADLGSHGLPRLIGILDLVRSGGRIVDFKTAAKTPADETAIHVHETQTSCYSVLYRESTGNEESGVELHYLIKTKIPKLAVIELQPMSEKKQSRLFRNMEAYVEGVGRRDFVPSPGFLCCACEYFNECRRWTGKEPG